MKRFSIIICTYNRCQYIYDALACVARNDYDNNLYELLLINNNSTDATRDKCEKFKKDFSKADFKYFEEYEQGLSYARNRGIREAVGEYLIFLDDDAFVQKDYLGNLDRYLGQYPDTAAFGGKIVAKYESGLEPEWMTPWGQSWVSAIDLGKEVSEFMGKRYPIGANMGFRREVLLEVGDFNVNLGRSKKNLMAGEEKDLFERLKKMNKKIYYFPGIAVEHIIPEGRTTQEYIKRMGQGVGMSEKLRCMNIGGLALCGRYFMEIVKWAATLVLFFLYCLKLQYIKAKMLVVFRYYVTKGLMNKNCKP